jgi:GNAT superfamily N-acetyltransferase
MRLVPYHPRLLPDLTRLINTHIHLVPPGWEVMESQVAAILANPLSLWEAHFSDDDGIVEPQETLFVTDGDTLLAAANWDVFQLSPHPRNASLNWILADPDHPAALTLLLNSLIERARGADCHQLHTGRFAFGVGWRGIASVWPHLIDGFKAAGFGVTQHWIMMTAEIDATIQRSLPDVIPFSLLWKINEAALEWEARAYSGEKQIGECECWGIPPHLRDCRAYDEWTTIEWLGVEEPYHRRGIGSYLMAEQLRFQATRGVRNVVVWTEIDNLPTRKLNKSFGFRDGPECLMFTKSLADLYLANTGYVALQRNPL